MLHTHTHTLPCPISRHTARSQRAAPDCIPGAVPHSKVADVYEQHRVIHAFTSGITLGMEMAMHEADGGHVLPELEGRRNTE